MCAFETLVLCLIKFNKLSFDEMSFRYTVGSMHCPSINCRVTAISAVTWDRFMSCVQKADTTLHRADMDAEIALRVHLCLMISDCSGERSFSNLHRIKNYFRSSVEQENLSMFSPMSMIFLEIRAWRQSSTISRAKNAS